MDRIAQLLQTILWVGLIAGIVWRFNHPIEGILTALHKRLADGSTLKAGPFELSGQLHPQDPVSLKEKAEREVQEALQAEPSNPSAVGEVAPEALRYKAADLQAKYFRAEDLVLRAIQAEYGAKVSRQVTAGADRGFDGAFVSNGRLNIVEVKYVASARSVTMLRESLDKLIASVSRYAWRNVQIILAVVFEKVEDVGPAAKRLEDLAAGAGAQVVIRCYSLSELERKFGVSTQD